MHLQDLLTFIIKNPQLHAKWLNSLSYLENCGARLISACEHPKLVREEMMKHAAEEFRHAWHLKKQILKLNQAGFVDYSLKHILGESTTWHYLAKLNCETCRYLKEKKLLKDHIPHAAYWFVTYAIEMRAATIYSIYQKLLKQANAKVSVMCIICEEKEHLDLMRYSLSKFEDGLNHANQICFLENIIYQNWMKKIIEQIFC